MNNKGFAITGILYTLFVLFMMILLSILSTISYKKGILEKTVLGLEDDFNLTEVTNLNTTYQIDGLTSEKTATVNGKYVFKLYTEIKYDDSNIETAPNECYIYLEKGQFIPESIPNNNTNPNFTLVPNDCNEYAANIVMDNPTLTEPDKLILTSVYEFKGSD